MQPVAGALGLLLSRHPHIAKSKGFSTSIAAYGCIDHHAKLGKQSGELGVGEIERQQVNKDLNVPALLCAEH
jgi:hypothetical protein